jgi:hypothetical protein
MFSKKVARELKRTSPSIPVLMFTFQVGGANTVIAVR